MIKKLRRLFDDLARNSLVPGAQFSLYHGGELHEFVAGVERAGTGRPVTPRSRFAYGSVSKIFTAALVMQLVEDGDVDLDIPVDTYLPELPADRPAPAPTARQLLSHTAGLVSDHDDGPVRATSLRRQAASLLERAPVAAPGTAFSYSNGAYSLAAYLVEVVTGQDWWETLESHLALPAGLDLAFVYDARDPGSVPATGSGHAVDTASGTIEPVEFTVEPALAPAGGLAGSATDLVGFGRAFMGPEDAALDTDIADPRVLHEMGRTVSAAAPYGLADGWGAGWALHLASDRLWYGHDGTLDGGTCNLRVDPEGGTALALTTNGTSGLRFWEDLVAGLRELGLDVGHYQQPTPRGRAQAPAREAGTDGIVGRYVNGDLMADVAPDDSGGFQFRLSNGFSGPMIITSDLQFSVTMDDLGGMSFSGRFLRDPQEPGSIASMQYNGRALRRTPLPARSGA
ncbi:serine hydrolase domain-containing protein [Streptomonospora salina]|uniref:CubicO group peptidase (Beta-lactamase class C family) n=1 Tax=Streptomonospora salina TaxID=104205 RepID=A0A841EHV2_9ACTN|nr:serine hydrolase domain-containing protein [Streptomonospora salina]MBB5999950.1 CubicO group peptidase (beta-lactamase class C family) [Streptomonospora salina]